jgi:O-antigen/teichoic acid export membrane protein
MYVPFLAQVAHGWTSLANRINLVAVVLIVPTLFWAVPHHGAMGAAVVWAGLNAGYVLIGIRLMHRRILPAQMLSWYRDDVGKPLLAGICVAVMMRQTAEIDFKFLSIEVSWLIAIFLLVISSHFVILSSVKNSVFFNLRPNGLLAQK